MGFSLNKISLLGRLGKDVETRFTTNNVSVSSFSMVTEHSYKKDGEWVNEPTWHNITGFNLSDFIKDKLKKGAQVYCEGRLQKREYTDKDGIKRYNTDVVVDPFSIIVTGESGKNNNGHQETAEKTVYTTDKEDLPF